MNLIKHPAAKAIVSAVISLVVIAVQAVAAIAGEHPSWGTIITTAALAVAGPALVYLQPNSVPVSPVHPAPVGDPANPYLA